jgi:hypothetical protein
MVRVTSVLAVALSVAACAQTSVMQVSSNEIMLTTSAAPICGATGSQDVAQQMAAIETLRRGFTRYIVGGAASQNNVGVMQTGPTYSNTYGSATVTGNSVYGQSTTYYGGQQTIVYGSHDTAMRILMLRAGDPGFDQGVDAQTILGPDWQKKVADGVNSC